nr:MAG TPA: hypothetical protein [Caudoviricetes sp.]
MPRLDFRTHLRVFLSPRPTSPGLGDSCTRNGAPVSDTPRKPDAFWQDFRAAYLARSRGAVPARAVSGAPRIS